MTIDVINTSILYRKCHFVYSKKQYCNKSKFSKHVYEKNMCWFELQRKPEKTKELRAFTVI